MNTTPNTTPRKMPTELAIRAHWADRLWIAKGYDSKAEFMERGTCFACGMSGNERAHILARAAGGDDTPENLHILCGVCHKDSEYLEGSAYMDWLMDRSALSMIMSGAARCGFNLAALVQPNILVEDLSECSRHVEVDTAPRSLEEHIHQVFAIHGIKGGQHGTE